MVHTCTTNKGRRKRKKAIGGKAGEERVEGIVTKTSISAEQGKG